MIKLIDILNEGIIQLTSDERNQIEDMIPKIIDIIQGPPISSGEYKQVDWINYQFADETLGKAFVYVGNDNPKASGYFSTKDPKNPNDNVIVIQQNAYLKYFNILSKGYSAITGDKNQGIEILRKTLKHELIHAKDPALNKYLPQWDIKKEGDLWLAIYKSGDDKRTKSFKFKTEEEAAAWINKKQLEKYNPDDYKVYYKSWEEFQTMTGQFFESIVTGVNRILSKNPSDENIKKIEKSLNEILNFYSGKSKQISQSTIDFIQDTDKRNAFQNIMKITTDSVLQVLGVNVSNSLETYIQYLNLIKQFNPEGYKEFLKDLYKTIDQAKDIVNSYLEKERENIKTYHMDKYGKKFGMELYNKFNASSQVPSNIALKEMETSLNEEFYRMQLLAGLITEKKCKKM